MKIYDFPHKGLRNGLSQLSILAGRTDYSNATEIAQLHQLGIRLFNILTTHAEDENSVTLAQLDMRCPGSSQHDFDDHEKIQQSQHDLERQLVAIHDGASEGRDMSEAGAEFYLGFTEFHGEYLMHTAEEERITQPLLWKHFTDMELAGHRREIMARNPPQTLLTWFEFVIPAQTNAERVGLLTGFMKAAPATFFAEAMDLIRGVIPASEFLVIEGALSAEG
jgi:hypothetical protein